MHRPEAELGTGHADISLEPLQARFRQLRVGYLIGRKYLKRTEFADEAGCWRRAVRRSLGRAVPRRCPADERTAPPVRRASRFTGNAVVFHG